MDPSGPRPGPESSPSLGLPRGRKASPRDAEGMKCLSLARSKFTITALKHGIMLTKAETKYKQCCPSLFQECNTYSMLAAGIKLYFWLCGLLLPCPNTERNTSLLFLPLMTTTPRHGLMSQEGHEGQFSQLAACLFFFAYSVLC